VTFQSAHRLELGLQLSVICLDRVVRVLHDGVQRREELTEIGTGGRDWWTLGFEATGPASLLRSALEAAAALVFGRALPGGVEPGPDVSGSYAQWLGQRPGVGCDAGG
jgi:hypothetical protein